MKTTLKTLLACLVLTGLMFVVSSCQTGDTKKEPQKVTEETNQAGKRVYKPVPEGHINSG